jgi:hypothetical protein
VVSAAVLDVESIVRELAAVLVQSVLSRRRIAAANQTNLTRSDGAIISQPVAVKYSG